MGDAEALVGRWMNDVAGIRSAGADSRDPAKLFVLLYDDLHRMAAQHLRKEHAGHTLSATALTHEAWFRLGEQTRTTWASRSHFLAVGSIVMRRILVHHAVAKRAAKRDGERVALTLAEGVASAAPDASVVEIHDALLAFEAVDPRAAKVVELKFFGGMEHTEIAEALGISVATVKREWSVARAWLLRELRAG